MGLACFLLDMTITNKQKHSPQSEAHEHNHTKSLRCRDEVIISDRDKLALTIIGGSRASLGWGEVGGK